MAKNVCPRCKEVILGFEDESVVRCSKCEVVFQGVGRIGDDGDTQDVKG